jgi:hypothetical protein
VGTAGGTFAKRSGVIPDLANSLIRRVRPHRLSAPGNNVRSCLISSSGSVSSAVTASSLDFCDSVSLGTGRGYRYLGYRRSLSSRFRKFLFDFGLQCLSSTSHICHGFLLSFSSCQMCFANSIGTSTLSRSPGIAAVSGQLHQIADNFPTSWTSFLR